MICDGMVLLLKNTHEEHIPKKSDRSFNKKKKYVIKNKVAAENRVLTLIFKSLAHTHNPDPPPSSPEDFVAVIVVAVDSHHAHWRHREERERREQQPRRHGGSRSERHLVSRVAKSRSFLPLLGRRSASAGE